ncbi:MAG: cation transporting ATPase C-terminal domain-containing protein, partial [Candidatus Harrisonbacteria bacterium]|nr:cation transporting ATPase C-terminal domain-containing protein [Candidatus Harrisonbacteria bacterium]
GVADLVLLDDNFETLVEAIHEGRGILANIRKAIVYLGSTVLDEVLVIGGALVMGLALPLNALQILWVNFFTDSFPGIAFAFEPRRDFGKKPMDLSRGVFTPQMKSLLLINGLIGGILILILYALLLRFGVEESLSRTVTYAAFASYSLFLAFAVRSLKQSIIRYNPFSNMIMNFSVLFGLSMLALSIYLPVLQDFFSTTALSFFWVCVVLAFGLLNIVIIELTKHIFTEKD